MHYVVHPRPIPLPLLPNVNVNHQMMLPKEQLRQQLLLASKIRWSRGVIPEGSRVVMREAHTHVCSLVRYKILQPTKLGSVKCCDGDQKSRRIWNTIHWVVGSRCSGHLKTCGFAVQFFDTIVTTREHWLTLFNTVRLWIFGIHASYDAMIF